MSVSYSNKRKFFQEIQDIRSARTWGIQDCRKTVCANIATGGYTGSNMLSIKVKFNFRWKSLTSQFLGKYSHFFENSFFVCKNLLGSLFLSKEMKIQKFSLWRYTVTLKTLPPEHNLSFLNTLYLSENTEYVGIVESIFDSHPNKTSGWNKSSRARNSACLLALLMLLQQFKNQPLVFASADMWHD